MIRYVYERVSFPWNICFWVFWVSFRNFEHLQLCSRNAIIASAAASAAVTCIHAFPTCVHTIEATMVYRVFTHSLCTRQNCALSVENVENLVIKIQLIPGFQRELLSFISSVWSIQSFDDKTLKRANDDDVDSDDGDTHTAHKHTVSHFNRAQNYYYYYYIANAIRRMTSGNIKTRFDLYILSLGFWVLRRLCHRQRRRRRRRRRRRHRRVYILFYSIKSQWNHAFVMGWHVPTSTFGWYTILMRGLWSRCTEHGYIQHTEEHAL